MATGEIPLLEREAIAPSAGALFVDQVDRRVIQFFAMVSDALAGSTIALLSGDREAAKILVDRDEEIDAFYKDIEQLVQDHIAGGGASPARLRYLVAVLGILPELERSADLAEHIARRAASGITADISVRARGLIQRMGEVASSMWRMAADAYGDRTPSVADRLSELDNEMDELHTTFIAELAGGGMPLPVIIELTLVGRFYERLGDHAVNLARRVPDRGQPVAGRSA